MIEDITLRNCIEFAVGTEEIGKRFYARLANKFSDNIEVAEIFRQLSKDEEVHRKQFLKLLEKIPQDKGVTSAPEKRAYVKAMSISEFFSKRHGPFKNITKIKNYEDALEKAFGLEKATLAYYQSIQEVIGGNPTLKKIIETEKSHIVNLMKAMISGGKFRSLQDTW